MHHALMLQLCLRHQIALLSPHHHNSQAEPYRLPLLQANFRSFSRSSAILVVVAVVTLLFSHSVMSDLCGHGLQHDGLPFPSPSPRTSSNSCSLSGWHPPNISSSVIPFSSCLQSFPASGCFPMSQLFPSGGQSIGASDSASVLPMNIQDWFL